MSGPVPLDIVNALDVLAREVEAEQALRVLSGSDWANGQREGAMIEAHRSSVARVRAAARALLELDAPP